MLVGTLGFSPDLDRFMEMKGAGFREIPSEIAII